MHEIFLLTEAEAAGTWFVLPGYPRHEALGQVQLTECLRRIFKQAGMFNKQLQKYELFSWPLHPNIYCEGTHVFPSSKSNHVARPFGVCTSRENQMVKHRRETTLRYSHPLMMYGSNAACEYVDGSRIYMPTTQGPVH